jgi:hypothetical protein
MHHERLRKSGLFNGLSDPASNATGVDVVGASMAVRENHERMLLQRQSIKIFRNHFSLKYV